MSTETNIDLNDALAREMVADTLHCDVESYCVQTYDTGFRNHLGASQIGRPCSRELWYGFRWVKKIRWGEGTKRSVGQIMRLFQRGHREEPSIIEYLEGIGCKFKYKLENQKRIESIEKHFGGSLDGVGSLPPKFNIYEDVLFEFKTASMAEFQKVIKKGVKLAKKEHWAQMCTYGFHAGIRFAVYIIVDKNTDEMHIEFLKLDPELGQEMTDKAASIIMSQTAPPKISLSQASMHCKWCNFKDVCHNDEPFDKNCRSCENAIPIKDGKWQCKLFTAQPIPDHIIPIGCDKWTTLK